MFAFGGAHPSLGKVRPGAGRGSAKNPFPEGTLAEGLAGRVRALAAAAAAGAKSRAFSAIQKKTGEQLRDEFKKSTENSRTSSHNGSASHQLIANFAAPATLQLLRLQRKCIAAEKAEPKPV